MGVPERLRPAPKNKDDGTIIGGKENFGRWQLQNKNFMTGFYINLDDTFTKFQPGN